MLYYFMDKFLLTDVDDAILDWFPQFRAYCENKLNVSLTERPTQYSMQKWLNITAEEIRTLIDEFDRDEESFGQLKPICQAEIYLPKFHADGYKIIVITASSTRPASMQRRRDNLVREFGDIFTDIHCVDKAENKREYLKMYPPSMFCEDKIFNAQMGYEEGHTGVVIRQLSNIEHETEYPHLTWVDNWEQIYNLSKN
jgi:hypothetical protein